MAKRLLINWDAIEPLYRAGILSLPEIAHQYEADHQHSQRWKKTVTHQAIAKHSKQKKWTRNIAERVKSRVQEELVAGQVAGCNQSEDEMVEQAAAEPIRVAKGQRARNARLLEIQDELAAELRASTDLDIMSRVRSFKDIAGAVRSLQDQQADQYKLNEQSSSDKTRIRVRRVTPEIDDE